MCVCVLARFAFQYNPSLQPRALVVFGCISKTVTHGQIKQIIRILSKASPLLSIDRVSLLTLPHYPVPNRIQMVFNKLLLITCLQPEFIRKQ